MTVTKPNARYFIAFVSVGLVAAAMLPEPVFSWDRHDRLMPWVGRSLDPAPAAIYARLRALPREATTSTSKVYEQIAQELELNPGFDPVAFPAVQDLDSYVNEPDEGMDRNLPDSADPRNDRRFMGGKTGPTSQGFRHMYFGGWRWDHPLTTFQIPTHALGQAPDRVQAVASYARELLRSGTARSAVDRMWGLRILLWSVHYVQDLAQPFHSAQVPSLRFVPWDALLTWPPSRSFERLITETTRTISNYHYAYEGLAERQLAEGRYDSCLNEASRHSSLQWEPSGKKATPRDLARAITEASIRLAPRVASAQWNYFRDSLMKPEVDLPNGKGVPDYPALAADPKLEEARKDLEIVTCEAYANAVQASRLLIQWALQE